MLNNKNYIVIKNFMSNDYSDYVENLLESTNFPWFFSKSVANENDKKHFYFMHNFFYNNVFSNFFQTIIDPFLQSFNFKEIFLSRAKANLFLRSEKQIKYGLHTDINIDKHTFTNVIYYVNSNNGGTEFEDGTFIPSIKNNLLIFNNLINHRSVGQTNTKTRINFNLNLKNNFLQLKNHLQ